LLEVGAFDELATILIKKHSKPR